MISFNFADFFQQFLRIFFTSTQCISKLYLHLDFLDDYHFHYYQSCVTFVLIGRCNIYHRPFLIAPGKNLTSRICVTYYADFLYVNSMHFSIFLIIINLILVNYLSRNPSSQSAIRFVIFILISSSS